MSRLAAVLKHLDLTPDQWRIISYQRQDKLFRKAESEMKRAKKASNRSTAADPSPRPSLK